MEAAEAVAPRSQLVPGFSDFRKGTGNDNDEPDGDNDDR